MDNKFDARGEHKKVLRKHNMEIVSNFFKENPDSTQKDAAEKLGLHYVTICKIMKELGAKKSVNYSFE
jgi:Mn-dependent DtxR family transcriptional regulator